MTLVVHVSFTLVYVPSRLGGRSLFWQELLYVYGLYAPSWCVGGDFDVVRFPSEKLGGGCLTSSMVGFENFSRDCSLQDLLFANVRFTWYRYGVHLMAS